MPKHIEDKNELVRAYIGLVEELTDEQIRDLFYKTISCDNEDEISQEDMKHILTDPYTLWEVEEIELEKMYRVVEQMLNGKDQK